MRENGPIIGVVLLLLAGLAGLMFFANGAEDRRLDGSVIGYNGLPAWLNNQNVRARKSNPRLSPNLQDLGIRILPLYDMNLDVEAGDPRDAKAVLRQSTLRDMTSENFSTKLVELQTVVVLPKWTNGVIETGVLHDQLLIELSAYRRLANQMGVDGLTLLRPAAGFTSGTAGGANVSLFHAQVFDPGTMPNMCRGEFSFAGGYLVAECAIGALGTTHFVSDPDLMSNHGLSVADNAVFAKTYVADLAGTDAKSVYVDLSADLLTSVDEVSDERRDYERSGSDLARFFEYPFSVLWAVLIIVLGVLSWRGAKRFGPAARPDENAIEQSKAAAIAAKARLLRLSANDGPMVADFVRGQIHDLTVQTLGPDLGAAGQARFFDHLARRDKALASAFRETSNTLVTNASTMPLHELQRGVETYKTLLDKIVESHGPVRISNSR